MNKSILLALLLSSCESPPWTITEFVTIPMINGGTCYVIKPQTVWNWQLQYADMVSKCNTKPTETNNKEMGT